MPVLVPSSFMGRRSNLVRKKKAPGPSETRLGLSASWRPPLPRRPAPVRHRLVERDEACEHRHEARGRDGLGGRASVASISVAGASGAPSVAAHGVPVGGARVRALPTSEQVPIGAQPTIRAPRVSAMCCVALRAVPGAVSFFNARAVVFVSRPGSKHAGQSWEDSMFKRRLSVGQAKQIWEKKMVGLDCKLRCERLWAGLVGIDDGWSTV